MNDTMSASFGQRLMNVFIAPEKTFAGISQHSNWKQLILPLVFILMMSLGASYLLRPLATQQQKDMIAQSEKLTDEQKDKALERMDDQAGSTVKMFLGAAASTLLTLFVSAGIFLFIGNFFGGQSARYIELLLSAVYIWMLNIVKFLVTIPLMLQKGTLFVHTSLVLAFPDAERQSLVFRLANQVELFRIWSIILWIIAFRVLYGYTTEKSTALVLPVWIIWAAISVLLTGLSPF